MKIKVTDYEYMKSRIQAKFPDIQKIRDFYKESGLSEKRMRWDILYSSVGSRWICDVLYPYLDDTHIDTALRKITK